MSKHIFKNVATHLPQYCQPTADILSQFGGKWSVAVFGSLTNGPRRFSEMAEGIVGISERMLTLTLKTMERDGMVTRRVIPGVPPRVEYELTDRARSLQGPMLMLHQWAGENAEGIAQSRREFDSRED